MTERDELINNLTEEFVTRSLRGETLPEVCAFIVDSILLVRGLNTELRAENDRLIAQLNRITMDRDSWKARVDADIPPTGTEAFRRAQAFNHSMSQSCIALLKTTEEKGLPPNPETLIAAVQYMMRKAWRDGEEADDISGVVSRALATVNEAREERGLAPIANPLVVNAMRAAIDLPPLPQRLAEDAP